MASESESESEDVATVVAKKAKKKNQSKSNKNQSNLRGDKIKMFDILRSYFEVNSETKKIQCTVSDCKSTVQRYQLFYLKRHFQIMHPSLLNELFPEEFNEQKKAEIEVCELYYDAVELVTINGCAFSILDSSSLKNMLKPRISDLERMGQKVAINRHMIGNKIAEVSSMIKERISAEFKGQMLSIMFDICTKRTLSVLGVSATTMVNDTVIARSLGIIQMKERHRGPYMADLVINLLKEYGISLRQLYSGTADNATNNDNTLRIIALHACNEIENDEDNFSEVDDIEWLDRSDSEIILGVENQIELHNELNNEDRYIELINEMTDELSRNANFLSPVQRIRCCAHTVQLAINTAMQRSNAKHVVAAVREMAKLLRTQVVNIQFRKLAPDCILPPLCMETRWNTDYIMVSFIDFEFSFYILVLRNLFDSSSKV